MHKLTINASRCWGNHDCYLYAAQKGKCRQLFDYINNNGSLYVASNRADELQRCMDLANSCPAGAVHLSKVSGH